MHATPHILVADDNVQSLGLVAAILRSAGYVVATSEGGIGAVEAAEAVAFDLILLDGMMPDLDGFAACRAIRGLPGNRRTPIVFLTGLTDDDTFEEATEAGADEVLAKPIRRSALLLRVRSLLRVSRLRQERDRSRRERAELTELLLRDLEGPVAIMAARARLLDGSEALAPSLRPVVRDLLAAERRFTGIVQNLMDLQRGAEGRFAPRPGDVVLSALLAATAATWAPRAAEAGLQLTVSAPESTRSLRLDDALIQRALDNLVEHALGSAHRHIELRAELIAGGVEVAVRDDGEPLSADDQATVDPSGRPDTVTGSLPRGRGLGLVLCRMVARAHEGDLAIRSGDDGTAVTLRLQELPAAGAR